MRYIADVPNPHYKIGLFVWNGKYIIKVETQFLEQIYKIAEMDLIGSPEDLVNVLSDSAFLQSISDRFEAMNNDLNESLIKLDLI